MSVSPLNVAKRACRKQFKAGGLMSYGASLSEAYRQMGIYTGKTPRKVKSSVTCPSSNRQNSSLSSISKRQRLWDCWYQTVPWRLLTRSLNNRRDVRNGTKPK